MGRKTPPHQYNAHITQAKFNSMIKSALRNASRWWKPAIEAKDGACVGIRLNRKTGKRCKHYLCNHCGHLFPSKDIKIDHIDPVIPITGFTDWNDFIDRLFAPKDAYQCLCDKCHDKKTLKEKQLRKHYENLKDNGDC